MLRKPLARSHRPPAERPPYGGYVASISARTNGEPKPRKPLICRAASERPRTFRTALAGVGTFPGWLNLAVAPASKGLIPQPVSMSSLGV
jgi:hypothetical protein